MLPLFNNVGTAHESLNETAVRLESITKAYFNNLMKENCSFEDISAASDFLQGYVGICGLHARLILQSRRHKESVKIASKELSDEEIALLKKQPNQLSINPNKIEVIKMFRNRTGQGLRESKDAVDNYIKENNL